MDISFEIFDVLFSSYLQALFAVVNSIYSETSILINFK